MSTEPTAAIQRFFGRGAQLTDVVLNRPAGSAPFAFWFVITDTTPTAASLAAALEFMARREGNQERDIVLRVGLPPRTGASGDRAPDIVNLVWNPTQSLHTSIMAPLSGPLKSHVLVISAGINGGIGMDAARAVGPDLVISNVTTQTLVDAASVRGDLIQRLRDKTQLP